jgi:aldose sugar dehydrogenase
MKLFFQTLFACSFMIAIISCKNRNPISAPPLSTEWPKDSVRVVQDSFSYPWEILWGKDNHIWVTERGGRILRIEPRSGARVFTFTVPDVVASGEGGLLGMVQHPNFSANGFLYIVYNYRRNNVYIQKVVRYNYQNNTLVNPLVLVDNIPAANIHNGSRLLITADEKLLISTGDAAIPSTAQDTSSLSGKILRINLDGTIPADNPFPNNRIWSYGHRNPQGMVLANNKLYTSEHGANIEDEINIIEKGRNCGWPSVEGPCNGVELNFCSLNNVREPIFSSGTSTLAYCGIDYYNGTRIPQWGNSLLLVTLKDQSLRQLKLSADGNSVVSSKTYLKNAFGRLRDVCISPEGRVYVCTSNAAGFDLLIEIQKPE